MLHNDIGTSFANTSYRDDDMYDAHDDDFEDCEDFEEEPNAKAKEFYKMVNTASEPIYPNNANFTTLEFVMELLRWKNRHNCSNNGFDELLHLIGLVLPDDHKLPEKYYTVRKMIRGLNMEYEKIDSCENDCMLFYKENSNKTHCDICKTDRYKVQKDPKKQKIPRKILRYFPITTRLQRLFMAEKTAKCMRWHHDRVVVEGQLSHPADGDEWKEFDRRFPRFSKEIRNVRLGLSTDGFDPFRDAHAKEYTVWPVVIIVYNLPPSMCTKAPYMFMPLLIPGPTDPTKDLHVYLRPLIDESYKACKCNGYKFSCVNEKELTSPNSGVVVIGTSYEESYGNYYGKVEEVLKLFYRNGHQVIVFKCHWFDHTTHVKIDRHRMTTVDVKSKLNADDVFVLASQAHQVYYAPNISNAKSSWYTVLTTKSRQVDESVSTMEKIKINNDALQNEVSNASSSHVERVTIRDPSNFFVDLRMFENDYSIDHDDEEESQKNKEAEDEAEENEAENDELSDNDDLL